MDIVNEGVLCSMEFTTAVGIIIDKLKKFNDKTEFRAYRENGVGSAELPLIQDGEIQYVLFRGNKGAYKIVFNESNRLITLECSQDNGDSAEYAEMIKMLFDINEYEERDIISIVNEIEEQLNSLYATKSPNVDKVKLPKSSSKTAVKNGMLSYDTIDLVTKFVEQFPELRDAAKENMLKYGQLLPEDFFAQHGTPLVMQIMRSGNDVQIKKLFRLLNDVYESGTNPAQDMIAVSILGHLQKDPALMAVADAYMNDYMKNPVHEVNKLLARENSSLNKKLRNPPIYKPKKKKSSSSMANMLQGQGPQN